MSGEIFKKLYKRTERQIKRKLEFTTKLDNLFDIAHINTLNTMCYYTSIFFIFNYLTKVLITCIIIDIQEDKVFLLF